MMDKYHGYTLRTDTDAEKREISRRINNEILASGHCPYCYERSWFLRSGACPECTIWQYGEYAAANGFVYRVAAVKLRVRDWFRQRLHRVRLRFDTRYRDELNDIPF